MVEMPNNATYYKCTGLHNDENPRTSCAEGCPQVLPVSEQREQRGENNGSDFEKHWYALRVTYARELKVQRRLEEMGVESFIPMQKVERVLFGKRIKRWMPVIHNLIFIHTETSRMKEIKADISLPLRYIMDRESNSPVIVPDKQMEDFIKVSRSDDEHIDFISPDAISIKDGDRVRVTGGAFAGIEGRYIRYKGHSKVAISIEGIVTVLTAFVPLKYIEIAEP